MSTRIERRFRELDAQQAAHQERALVRKNRLGERDPFQHRRHRLTLMCQRKPGQQHIKTQWRGEPFVAGLNPLCVLTVVIG